jgi:hypothetical protein
MTGMHPCSRRGGRRFLSTCPTRRKKRTAALVLRFMAGSLLRTTARRRCWMDRRPLGSYISVNMPIQFFSTKMPLQLRKSAT